MELHEFVQRTIEEIISGVKASHQHAVANGASVAIASNCAEIKFDVAVTTTEAGESKKGAGIFVGGFGVGAQGKSGSTSSSESRIQFSVFVNLPQVDAMRS
jgi:hypothetical protein